jgi:hypothetical protein
MAVNGDPESTERRSLLGGPTDAKQEKPLAGASNIRGESSDSAHYVGVGIRPVAYGLVNVSSAVAIVMANKVAMYTYGFKFPVALTLIHMIVTAIGMRAMSWCALFDKKPIPFVSSMQLASANVGSIVFNNLSLQWNTVSFYQVSSASCVKGISVTTNCKGYC